MNNRVLSGGKCSKTFEFSCLLFVTGTLVLGLSALPSVNAQTSSKPIASPGITQSFSLADLNALNVVGGKAEIVQYRGRTALHLTTTESSEKVMAVLKGTQIQDGIIEADVATKFVSRPGVRMPGFVGIAFRTKADASSYDLFYVRPGNSHSEDQAMRNHSVQYSAAPGYDWYRLRREWPSIYESYVDLQPEQWTKMKIEIHGRTAKLFVNGAENPSLIVNGMKGEELQGRVALWGYSGEDSYFSNVKVTPAAPVAVTNGGEASGNWAVKFASDYGTYEGIMDLHRDGNAIKGTWSGAFGQEQAVSGTWRNGYVELTFNGSWSANKVPATATLAGWIDGDSAGGRMKVEGRADGPWTAQRKK